MLCDPVIIFTIRIIQLARISPKKKAELFRLQINLKAKRPQRAKPELIPQT